MTASELRINNYIRMCLVREAGWFPAAVTEIHSHNTIRTKWDDMGAFVWEFLPIDEGYLMRLGFLKYPSAPNCFYIKYSEQGELVIFNSKTPVAIANNIEDYYYMFNGLIHPIKYIHQVQNLHLILSGKELEMKL